MVEENTNDGFKETINTIQNVCIEDLMECLVENAMEYYECFDADIGIGGLDETAESELVVPLFLAYDYIRGASAELIYEQFKRTDTDSFIRDFDVSFW